MEVLSRKEKGLMDMNDYVVIAGGRDWIEGGKMVINKIKNK